MALAILSQLRDFVGAGVGQSCGCETAQGNQHGIRSQQTVTGRRKGRGLWEFVLTPRLVLKVYVLLGVSDTKY